jgi:transposase
MRCTECGRTFVEPNPFAFPGEKVSAVTVYNVLQDCSRPHETFKAIAERYHISPSTVLRIFDSHVNIPRRRLPRYLVVDETYAFHTAVSDYVFVMMDYETMDIIDVLPSRKKADLDAYFQKIPLREREEVQIVSSDMWNTYRDMTHRWFPKAVHSCDSFHLKMELSRCVQKVRIRIMNHHRIQKKEAKPVREMKPDELLEFSSHVKSYYLLKKFAPWMLYKRPSDGLFDPNRKKKYNRVFREYLNYHDIYCKILETDNELSEAVALQEQLYLFFRKSTMKTAPKALKELIYNFSTSTVKEMCSFSATLRQWRTSIINSFIPIEGDNEEYEIDDSLPNAKREIITEYLEDHKARKRRRINSSVIENRNKLIKDIKHCSSGYSNWHRFRNRVLLCLNSETTFFLEPQPTSREWINEKKKRTKKD